MARNAAHQINRAAPRYRLTKGDQTTLRLAAGSQNRIFVTRLYDISVSGVSFLTTVKLAPMIGEVIKLQFSPMGEGVQIACLGRVVRIETPRKGAEWARFADSVKVGVAFHKLPPQYSKLLATSLRKAFSRQQRNPREVIEIRRNSMAALDLWLSEHWKSVAMSAVLIVGAIVGLFMLITEPPNAQEAPQWSTKFFQKVINK